MDGIGKIRIGAVIFIGCCMAWGIWAAWTIFTALAQALGY